MRQKNVYFKLKGKTNESVQLKKCSELGLLVPIEELKDEDEEEDLVLASAGLSKALLK